MLPCTVGEADRWGRLFLQRGTPLRTYPYYDSLNAAVPLLTADLWKQYATGFYINSGCNMTAVRVSYFTLSKKDAVGLIEADMGRRGLRIIPVDPPNVDPRDGAVVRVSECYGGEELRFRKYLCCYTAVGLDIMQADLLHAKCLILTFRWQVMRARKDYRRHFRASFERLSPTFAKLDGAEREQFWADLEHWPNPPQVDWAHFLVNMVLACDWSISQFLSPQPALTIAQVNCKAAELGFRVPEGWNADSHS